MSLRLITLAFASALLLATPAHAGIFSTPLEDSSVCGDFDVEDEGFASPTVFAGSPHCVSLCKKAASECKKFVGKVASCYSSWFKDSAGFQTRNCSEYTPASAARECKDGVALTLKLTKLKIEGAKDSGIEACEVWGSDCDGNCGPH